MEGTRRPMLTTALAQPGPARLKEVTPCCAAMRRRMGFVLDALP